MIRADEEEGGVLEFGTEIIAAADGSLVALLGASPGASTSAAVGLDILQKCFESKMETPEWQKRLKKMIPASETALQKSAALVQRTRKRTAKILKLN